MAEEVNKFVEKAFDFLILGGGTAGLAVAARLSEDPAVKVGIIEAGSDRRGDVLVDAPNLYIQTWTKPEYDFSYQTVPQKGTGGKVHGWVRGKVLGGSSAVNYGMYSMASRTDLDNWAELGNSGWGFDDMLPYYRKSETYSPPKDDFGQKINSKYVDPLLRGTNGPIQVAWPETELTWPQEVWPTTCINAGWPVPGDPRTGSAIGGFNQLLTLDPKEMKRSYAASAYWTPNADRPNLSLLTEAFVEKIEVDRNGTATGVRFQTGGKSYSVRVNKEVIVCGGVINSPQILELSGIGGASVLQKAGIDQVVDLPSVGENLNDHTATVISMESKDKYPSAEALLRSPDLQQQAMAAYLTQKTGPFANAASISGFVSLDLVQPDFKDAAAHIETLVKQHHAENPNSDPAGRDDIQARQITNPKEAISQMVCLPLGIDLSEIDSPLKPFAHTAPGYWFSFAACSTRSLSRGSVHIASKNPTEHPIIDPNYFSHPLDLDIAARTILYSFQLLKTEPLVSYLKQDDNGNFLLHPSWSKGEPKTLEEAKTYVQGNTVTEYHPIGTCAMLPKERGGVVSPSCKVYGTSNIRVVDASIFPTHVQGNIVSLVYAVAEKASDLIKKDHGMKI